MTVRGALTSLDGAISVYKIKILQAGSTYELDRDSNGQSLSRSYRDKASPDSRSQMSRLGTLQLQLSVYSNVLDICRGYRYKIVQPRSEH